MIDRRILMNLYILSCIMFIAFMGISIGSWIHANYLRKEALESMPSIYLSEFKVSDLTINFTVDLYDNEKISKIEIDLLSKDGVWKPKYSEIEEAETIIEGYSKSIRLLCIVWNSEKNAYDVYVYEYSGEWVNNATIGVGENATITYNVTEVTVGGKPVNGSIRICVESENHIRIEWEGRAERIYSYLGIWVMDNERNQNATVFEAEKQEEARIIPVEMRPICNETEEAPTPEFTRSAIYIEIAGRYFKLRNYIALQFAGFWNNLSISVGDYSWFSIGNATAHAFVIPVSDWNAFDDARIDVLADGVHLVGYVRVVYWWEDWRMLLVASFFVMFFVLLGIAVYTTARKRRE